MNLLEIMQRRRSVRSYTGERIPDEKLTAVLQAGLLSPSSRALCPWELVVVRDKAMLKMLSQCRAGAAKMLEGADAAVVVIADEERSDVWIEDCSIVMANMHLMADSMGLGSCWIQGRLREAAGGESTEAYLRRLLGFPETYRLEAVLSLGMPQEHLKEREMPEISDGKIHWERY